MARIAKKEIETDKGLSLRLRSAEPADAAQLLALFRSTVVEPGFMVTQSDEFSLTEEQEREWIEGMTSKPGNVVIVAEHDQSIIGLIDFHSTDKKRVLAHSGSFGMSVVRQYRNRGVGTLLLKELLEWARQHPDIEKVMLAVISTNENAIAFYRKHGFIEEGRRIRSIKYAEGEYADDILMYYWVGP